MECPFYHMDGTMYVQCDGVSMGNSLGVTFANYYMCNLENSVLSDASVIVPEIYARYVDDCYVVVKSESDLMQLIDKFKGSSVLNFTHEIGGDKLNFLDVSVELTPPIAPRFTGSPPTRACT